MHLVVEVLAIVLGAIGIAAAVVVAFAVEWLKRPRLAIAGSTFRATRPVAWTFATVRVFNRPITGWLGSIVTRQSAEGCLVSIEFRRWREDVLALPAIRGRWSSSPEPLRSQILLASPPNPEHPEWSPGETAPQVMSFYDPGIDPPRLTVPPSHAGEEIAVAVLRDDGTAYAWGTESYAYAEWRKPEWQLVVGTTYAVTVRVEGSGVTETKRFTLAFLSSNFQEFDLEPVD